MFLIRLPSWAVLYTPPPVLLDSDRTARSPSGSEWSPSGVQSDSVHSIELYFEVYFPSGVRVESEWSPSGPIYSMLLKQFASHYSVVTSVRSDSTRIGLGLTT
jgi:hypothetical protein